ncbi:MAG: histidine phosphatase family protein, partial [Alphaproteobacteria bacterium]|nr:histidine phosphatase family protein [Alphaproteobacteria bacterium]
MNSHYLIRHGETEWNAQKRMQGQIRDVPLNAAGLEQARQAAQALKQVRFDLIIASPLDRAAVTAQIIGTTTGIGIHYNERLIERGLGAAEGKTLDEIGLETTGNPLANDKLARDWIYTTHLPPGAESIDALKQRALNAFHDLIQTHAGKTILIVSHGAWLRAL